MRSVPLVGDVSDMIRFWQKCEIAVLPPNCEGLPKVLREAASFGLPLLGAINARYEAADLSYIIDVRQHWGKGNAILSIVALTEIGFLQLNLVKICASIYANNNYSLRVLE